RDVDRASGTIIARARRVGAIAVLIDTVAAQLGTGRARTHVALRAIAGTVASKLSRPRACAEPDRARLSDRPRIVDPIAAIVVDAVADLDGVARGVVAHRAAAAVAHDMALGAGIGVWTVARGADAEAFVGHAVAIVVDVVADLDHVRQSIVDHAVA